MSESHPCCQSHCCVIHGCKYGHDDCPVVNEVVPQEGGCEDCGLEQEGYYDDVEDGYPPGISPYGCPKCGSHRIVFSGRYAVHGDFNSPHLRFVLCLDCKHEGQWDSFKGNKDHVRRLMTNPEDFGHLVEGIVEQDPMSDRYVIRYEVPGGGVKVFDVQETLKQYKGQEVRLIVASLETVERVAKLVEDGQLSVDDALISKK